MRTSFMDAPPTPQMLLGGGSNYTWTGGGSGGSASGGTASGSGPSGPDQNSSAPRNPSAPANNNVNPATNLNPTPHAQDKEDSLSSGSSQQQHHVVRRDFFRQPLAPDDMSLPDDRPWYMR